MLQIGRFACNRQCTVNLLGSVARPLRVTRYTSLRACPSQYAPRFSTSASRPTKPALRILGVLAILTTVTAIAWISQHEAHADASSASSRIDDAKSSPQPVRYATRAELAVIIEELRTKLDEDQVTTNEDELLGHGYSPNTYHSEA
jgi:hypothetical protein